MPTVFIFHQALRLGREDAIIKYNVTGSSTRLRPSAPGSAPSTTHLADTYPKLIPIHIRLLPDLSVIVADIGDLPSDVCRPAQEDRGCILLVTQVLPLQDIFSVLTE